MNKIQWMSKLLLTLLLGGTAILMLVPILLTLTNSLMTEQEIGRNYDLIGQMIDVGQGGRDRFINLKIVPDWISLGQYAEVLILSAKFLNMFWNSVGLVVPIVVGQTMVGSLAAYAFARLRFPGRDKLFMIYLMTMLMPFQVTLVPNYMVIDKLGLMNHTSAIILPGIFGAFAVFMMRQFMAHIPGAYSEAAMMDGAGQWVIFWRIILPLARPGLAALLVLLFVDYWNMIEQPLIFLQDAYKQPLSLYLAQINKEALGIGFAASALYMAPVILLFLHAESYFIEGVQLSGIKG
ncbi:carbohydrate ABC transporter permease [Paenibacillus glucanolyticus]|jgi:multiple sugar transport system permease protein|uniref:Sugar ABC transporter permease n=1 Tax=Paenibacillus glucanolyticus TaxID=59843 RepID=A0A163LVA5_9BACL|nr:MULTISPECIES: carbohydrate ABC transporter permease [Paenibacillus]ANA82431.1 sugar ABC transporter permease [Paenibacillus glucanolyticus]AVV58830.1 carbohydrate ABC transporter permease [Paenibacillus glucanolyticus]ETT33866.1 binding-protein-dependent transport system inner membrane protein [Paenibacillus sp. FSL R5-808]KZS48499.1 sugar ABC transporter permease [Paenibacillus glucanolyticus]MPY17203.1 carbohydrate ABC transporter permease [Paenibacillus glucanolyticus]